MKHFLELNKPSKNFSLAQTQKNQVDNKLKSCYQMFFIRTVKLELKVLLLKITSRFLFKARKLAGLTLKLIYHAHFASINVRMTLKIN